MQQGNERAFTELYRRYYAHLCFKAFKRIPSVSIVEEIVQDVFMNLWMKSAELDIKGCVKAYLYATLRNKILFALRTEHNRSGHADRIKQLTGQPVDQEHLEVIYARETEEYINRIIKNLSPQCQKAFLLSRFEHLSYREIAQQMHISINTVEKHIAKALKMLREKLSEHGDITFLLPLSLLILSFEKPF